MNHQATFTPPNGAPSLPGAANIPSAATTTFRVTYTTGTSYGPAPYDITLHAEVAVGHFRALERALIACFGGRVWEGLTLDEAYDDPYYERDWVREARQPDGTWLPIARCGACGGQGHCYDGLDCCDTCGGAGYLIALSDAGAATNPLQP